MSKTDYQKRIAKAQDACAYLAKYNAEISKRDKTVVIVPKMTQKLLKKICTELQCSGYISDSTKSGIIRNFGMYK